MYLVVAQQGEKAWAVAEVPFSPSTSEVYTVFGTVVSPKPVPYQSLMARGYWGKPRTQPPASVFDDLARGQVAKAVRKAKMRVEAVSKVRYVRTRAGEERFGQPINSIIVADKLIKGLRVVGISRTYPGFMQVENGNGDKFVVGAHEDAEGWEDFKPWVAVDHETDVVAEADTEDAVLQALDRRYGVPFKDAPAKKTTPAAKKTAAKKTPAKRTAKKTPATPRTGVKTKEAPRKPRDRSIAGVPPPVLAGGIVTTPAVIKKKRAGNKPPEQTIAYYQARGWRLLNDDERDALSAKGKPIPPRWSHVLVYEGGEPKPKVTVNGINWDWRVQPHLSTTDRKDSLEQKFARHRRLAKKVPALMKSAQAALAKDDAALLVAIMLHTGGRADTDPKTATVGITSLQAKHVKVGANGTVTLTFPGKRGVTNTYTFRDPAIAKRLVAAAKAHPTGRLFPDTDDADTKAFIREKTGMDDAINHDLRTYVANATALAEIKKWIAANGKPETPAEVKKAWTAIAKAVGLQLNDGHTVVHNNYIDPLLWQQLHPAAMPGNMGVPLREADK